MYSIELPDAHKAEKWSDKEWHLPQHPVAHPKKPGKLLNVTTKLHGGSLNKSLLTGPDIIQNLNCVILCFRQQPYAISFEFEGLFPQIRILPSDPPSVCSLGHEDPTTNFVLYQYMRQNFGGKGLDHLCHLRITKHCERQCQVIQRSCKIRP